MANKDIESRVAALEIDLRDMRESLASLSEKIRHKTAGSNQNSQEPSSLSAGAKGILRHFLVLGGTNGLAAYSDTLGVMFKSPDECKKAQEELSSKSLIVLGRLPGAASDDAERMGGSLTVAGERYLLEHDLEHVASIN